MSVACRIDVIQTVELETGGEGNYLFLQKCLEKVGLQQHYVR